MGLNARLKSTNRIFCMCPWEVKVIQDIVQSHVDYTSTSTCLPDRKTAKGPAGVLWCSSGGLTPVVQNNSWPQSSGRQAFSHSVLWWGCFLGTRMMVECLKQEGTSQSSRDRLKICVKLVSTGFKTQGRHRDTLSPLWSPLSVSYWPAYTGVYPHFSRHSAPPDEVVFVRLWTMACYCMRRRSWLAHLSSQTMM